MILLGTVLTVPCGMVCCMRYLNSKRQYTFMYCLLLTRYPIHTCAS